jgi:DNA-binding GntR family transcriptional regulator
MSGPIPLARRAQRPVGGAVVTAPGSTVRLPGPPGRTPDPGPDPVFGMLQIDKHSRTLVQAVTQSLRDAIVRGYLAPGTPLRQDRLAEAFGISRVPLRESLRELVGEGLVVLEAHKGAVVASLSMDELDELYAIVWSLEEHTLHKAVPAMADADIAAMQDLFAQMEVETDPVAWYSLNVAFHRRLIIVSGLNRVLRMIDAVRWNICRYVSDPVLFARERPSWLKRNGRLLAACRRRDLDAALLALEAMRRKSTSAVRQNLATKVGDARPPVTPTGSDRRNGNAG